MFEDFEELPEILLAADYIERGSIDRRRVDGEVIYTLNLVVYERDERVLDFPDYIICYHREVQDMFSAYPREVTDMQLPFSREGFLRTDYYTMLKF